MLSIYRGATSAIYAETLTMTKLLTGILTNPNTTAFIINLPTGTSVNGSLAINQSIDWSVINTGTITSTVTVGTTGSTGHTVIGNMVVAIGTSGAFRIRVSALNIAIPYRMS